MELYDVLGLKVGPLDLRLMNLDGDPSSVAEPQAEDGTDADLEVEAAVDLQRQRFERRLDVLRIAGPENLVDENRMCVPNARAESQHAGQYRPAAMPALEISPFDEAHLDAAAGLLAARHRRHREAEPLLAEQHDFRAEIEALWRGEEASGAVGIRDGRVVGYMLGIRKEARWGPNIWVDPAGHAAEEAEDVRDLYAAAAADWVDEGRTRHYVVAPASDAPLLDAWARLSFGRQHASGIREIPEAGWPEGVRLADARDLDAIIDIAPVLPDLQDRSPVFGQVPRETEDELRTEIAEDLENADIANLVAEIDGRVVGNLVIAPTELSSTHAGLARVPGAVLLAYAATKPEVRGLGTGVAMTNAAFAWARAKGYETMVTDWRETNLLSSRFWPKRGFRRTFLRLYRSIP
jgi:GNAT superfamily N-acetyltransferase